MAKSSNLKVKVAFFATGVESIGNKSSQACNKDVTMEAHPTLGIIMKSLKSGKIVLVPYPNVKCAELFPDALND